MRTPSNRVGRPARVGAIFSSLSKVQATLASSFQDPLGRPEHSLQDQPQDHQKREEVRPRICSLSGMSTRSSPLRVMEMPARAAASMTACLSLLDLGRWERRFLYLSHREINQQLFGAIMSRKTPETIPYSRPGRGRGIVCTPLRLRGRIGVFRRREGCLLAGPSRTPLLPALAVWHSLIRGVSSRRGAPPADPRSSGSAFPSPASTSSFLCSSTRAMYMHRGGRMCFPVRDNGGLHASHRVCHRSCPFDPRALRLLGRPDVFSRSRLSTTSSPLQSSPTLLLVTSSRSTGMVSTDAVLAWIWWSLSSKLERGQMDAGALVCAIIHSGVKPQEILPEHAQVLVFFAMLEIRGGAENLSPAGDRFLGLRRSFEKAKASRPPARGRLAGGASV